ncbi:hypothetical protein Tsubulata_026405 [Turnera subulata]|uniref:Uncharacterized protein n=1 Tax=Turnera subulata TaxID=218843 RepID=A0A9Q0F9X1_9ROSI|nr:hypothetical protein Tsubulata_026405 [Turnera subulata]
MKKFPVDEDHGPGDYSGYDFDPQVDFRQFLEEARQHAREKDMHPSLPQSKEDAGNQRMGEEPKSKKSWKNSLLKWWKLEKKSKPIVESTNGSHISNLRRKGHNSGPIYGSSNGAQTKHRRPTSGPLSSLFNSSKRVQNETPYMCLDQVNSSNGVRAYGPVYLVT